MNFRSLVSVFLASIALLFAGCSSASKIPGVSFDSWTHDGNYGAFTTHVEAHGAHKDADGKLHVESYTGSMKVMGGYGPSDTITGLVIDPKDTKPVEVLPEKK